MAVIPFTPRAVPSKILTPEESNELDGTGQAICMCCKHEWAAQAPCGTIDLECPNCHTMKGHFKFRHYPQENEMIRVCDCGNDLFIITPQGHLCANCGTYQRY